MVVVLESVVTEDSAAVHTGAVPVVPAPVPTVEWTKTQVKSCSGLVSGPKFK